VGWEGRPCGCKPGDLPLLYRISADIDNALAYQGVVKLSEDAFNFIENVNRHLMEAIPLQLPLHCWDIVAMDRLSHRHSVRVAKDLDSLLTFQDHYGWDIDLEVLLQNPYEALIVTDPNQIIQWVNPGFTSMTGYSARYAIGRHPSFLQGPLTKEDTRVRIRLALKEHRATEEIIFNYRKNGDSYACQVQIFPLHNRHGENIHYLALEKEVV